MEVWKIGRACSKHLPLRGIETRWRLPRFVRVVVAVSTYPYGGLKLLRDLFANLLPCGCSKHLLLRGIETWASRTSNSYSPGLQ